MYTCTLDLETVYVTTLGCMYIRTYISGYFRKSSGVGRKRKGIALYMYNKNQNDIYNIIVDVHCSIVLPRKGKTVCMYVHVHTWSNQRAC